MQIYTHDGWSASYNELGDILRAHGGLNYFDSITSSTDGSAYVTTLTKNGTDIVINQPNETVFVSMTVDGYTFSEGLASYCASYIHKIYTCDSAIVMIPKRGDPASAPVYYGTLITIGKAKNGDTCVMLNQTQYNANSNTQQVYVCISIDSNGTKTTLSSPFIQNNTNDYFLSTANVASYNGFMKDVYLCTHRPIRADEPFMLAINDISYASFGYGTILVKTN